MIESRPVFLTLGFVLCAYAAAMLLPALIDIADNHPDWKVFAFSALVTFFVGSLLMILTNSNEPIRINVRTGFLMTAVVWIVGAAFAALPFIGVGISYTDAYFETMSGLSTTGSTVLTQLDVLPRGILLWRALLQFIGGVGIIVTAIIMLPFLRIGGMQLFMTESSDRSEKILPRSIELTLAIAAIYGFLVFACAVAYMAFGMTGFDAVCHAFATVSTGGFSTHDQSFAFFQSTSLKWVAIIFMILGSLPFVLLYKGVSGQFLAALKDEQIRGFLIIVLIATAAVAINLHYTGQADLLNSISLSAFTIVSTITTTGFVTDDYSKWGPFAIGVIFLLTFLGGCSGSTAGGIKIYRLQIALLLTRSHHDQLIAPHRVTSRIYNNRHLNDDVAFSVIAFLFVYLASMLMFTVLLAAAGLDILTAFSSSMQAIGNVGPGLGEIVGPAGNFATLPTSAKWILSFEMLLGRLELFTIIVLLRPHFWRW